MKLLSVGGVLLPLAICVAAGSDFDSAVTAFQRGDYRSAETTLHEILSKQPNDPSALGLLGAVLDSEQKSSEAEAVYRRALRFAPNSPTLLNNYGNHQLTAGDIAGAKASYLKAVALDPSRANANLQLASIALDEKHDRKHGEEALRYLSHVPAEARSSAEAQLLEMRALFLSGRTKEAQAIVARLSPDAANDPRLGFTAGLALAAAGQFSDAEPFFSQALEKAPAEFDILYNLGLAAYHAHDLQRAHDALQSALGQRPEDVDALYNLAGVNIDLKQREAALQLLAEAARINPSRADVQLAVAQTSSALGFYADARLAYEKYLKLRPGDETAQREHIFMDAVSSHPREGLTALQAFSRSHPNDATAHYEVGLLEAQTDPSDARAQLNQAISIEPDFAPARLGRGVVTLLDGHADSGLPDLEFAAARYPDNSSVLDRLGEAYTALNRSGDAVKVLRRASEISPRDARVLMHLSRALSKGGQTEEARAVLARFRAIGSQSGNLIPQPGIVELLSLSPEQQQARYRDEVRKRLEKDPQNADLNLRYLEILLDEANPQEAVSAAAHLLDLKPLAPQAAEAGHALVKAGEYAAAKPLLEYAAASSSTPAVRLDLAIAVFHVTGAAQAALAQLDQIPEAARSGDYFLARAQLLDAASKSEEASEALSRALMLAPTRPDLYTQATGFLIAHQRYDEATRLLQQAARTLPDNPQILLLQANVFTAAHRSADAERVFKHIEDRWPEWVPAYVSYGLLLSDERRTAEARAQLDIAVALAPSDERVQQLSTRLATHNP